MTSEEFIRDAEAKAPNDIYDAISYWYELKAQENRQTGKYHKMNTILIDVTISNLEKAKELLENQVIGKHKSAVNREYSMLRERELS